MNKKIKLIFWENITGDSTRGNKEALEEAGHFVDANTISKKPDFSNYDMILSTIPDLEFDTDTPLITQINGYGGSNLLPGKKPSKSLMNTFDKSDIVTTLDPAMYYELNEYTGKAADMKIIPNGKPSIEKGSMYRHNNEINVMYFSHGMDIKEPERFLEVIDKVDEKGQNGKDIVFWVPVNAKRTWNGDIDWFRKDNVKIYPQLPHKQMINLMRSCEIGVIFSQADIIPNTALESFMTGTPLVTNNIGTVPSISREHMDEVVEDFGMNTLEFTDKWYDKFSTGEGEHYRYVSNVEQTVEAINKLANNEEARVELINNGGEWIDKYWEPRDRGKIIGGLVE